MTLYTRIQMVYRVIHAVVTTNARLNYTSSCFTNVQNIAKAPASLTLTFTFGLSKDAWSGSFYIQNGFDETSETSDKPDTAQQFLGEYPDAVRDESLFFSSASETYSNYSLRYPTGHNFGLRPSYRF
ncbi:MAG: hypothetical protein KTR16_04115 [Acidiferrobacterales bacterium]|nr:hypothetical protein [Acidiferrobacterales bacterium]